MTPGEREEFWIRAYRLRAAAHRGAAARDELNATSLEAARAMKALTAAMVDGDTRDVAAHPDLAELDVQLDGYYGGLC
ncbi:hypothetical protein AB0D10_05180 [Kitasatospora sp. NPDC048545]|uniref:hypothetical protein n=1 Tax=Kitasatospora sp. NPDC048545 TaxID=3157208 RepID=UPI0034028757